MPTTKNNSSKKTKTIQKTKEKKTTSKKVSSKKMNVELKEPVIKENVDVKNNINVKENIEVKENTNIKKNTEINYKSISILLFTLLLILTILFINSKPKNYIEKFSNICENCENITEQITIPANYFLSQDNELYYMDGNKLVFSGGINCAPYTKENYDELKKEISEYYEYTESKLNEYDELKFNYEYLDKKFNYYFLFKEDHLIQIYFSDTNEDIQNQIINSIK